MTSSYDDYSLKKLEEWVHDVMSCDVSSEQIYDTIVKVVQENVEYHSEKLMRSTKLLELLNVKKKEQQSSETLVCDSTDETAECRAAWNDFWKDVDTIQDKKYVAQYTEEELNAMCENAESEEERELCLEYNVRESEYYNQEVQKWVLPVDVDDINGDYFVTIPEDILNQLNWKEGDMLEWFDNRDGSFSLKKS